MMWMLSASRRCRWDRLMKACQPTRRVRGIVAGLLALTAWGGAIPAARPHRAPPSHVITIVMENKEASQVLGRSRYVAKLARRYGQATRSYAVTHPSLPNYLALTSGSTHGIASDCTDCHLRARNLADQLAGAGISWRAYLQGMPAPCFRGAAAGRYAKKHNPFMYYDDVAGRASRCRRLVPYGRLAGDLRPGRLPTYSLVVPDLCDDTHDCGVATGDRFLRRLTPRLLRA